MRKRGADAGAHDEPGRVYPDYLMIEDHRDPSTGRAVDSSREDKSVLFGRGVRPTVICSPCGTSD